MSNNFKCLTVFSLLFFFAAGCGTLEGGGDSDGGVPADGMMVDAAPLVDAFSDPCVGDVDLADFWDCYNQVLCMYAEQCIAGLSGEECEQSEYGIFGPGFEAVKFRFGDAIAAGRINYDRANAGECVSASSSFECYEFFERQEGCQKTFKGTVPNGAECSAADECATRGARCQGTENCELQCCTGFCIAGSPIGGNCAGNGHCIDGAHCVGGMCRSGDGGASCGSDWNCDEEYWCGEGGRCIAVFPSGASCSRDSQCPGFETCVGNIGTNTGNCQIAANEGDLCDGYCEPGSLNYCQRASPEEVGMCVGVPGLGESCALSNGCDYQNFCNRDRLCEPKRPAGAGCTQYKHCENNTFCSNALSGAENGTCIHFQSDGAICQWGDHCKSGICTPVNDDNSICEPYINCFE